MSAIILGQIFKALCKNRSLLTIVGPINPLAIFNYIIYFIVLLVVYFKNFSFVTHPLVYIIPNIISALITIIALASFTNINTRVVIIVPIVIYTIITLVIYFTNMKSKSTKKSMKKASYTCLPLYYSVSIVIYIVLVFAMCIYTDVKTAKTDIILQELSSF